MQERFLDVSIYSEGNGFFVCCPSKLEELDDRPQPGVDLLARYAVEAIGEVVISSGALMPLVVPESDDYRVRVVGADCESMVATEIGVSLGWCLHAIDGMLVVGGLGYLRRWDPKALPLQYSQLSRSWFEVTVRWGYSGERQRTIELRLRQASGPLQSAHRSPLVIDDAFL